MVAIALIRFILDSFFDPSRLWQAVSFKRKTTVFLFLLLSAIIGFPFLVMNLLNFNVMGQDAEQIEKRLPEFEITDGEIQFSEPLDTALVVKTNSINLIIDMNDQYDDREEQKDIERTPISLLFKENHLTLQTPQLPIEIAYQNAEGVTDEIIRTMLNQMSNMSIVVIIPILLASFITGMIEAAIRYLFFSLIANIFSLFMRVRLPFSVNFKVLMAASFVPTFILALLNGFQFFPGGQLIILLSITLYMYYKGIISHFKNSN